MIQQRVTFFEIVYSSFLLVSFSAWLGRLAVLFLRRSTMTKGGEQKSQLKTGQLQPGAFVEFCNAPIVGLMLAFLTSLVHLERHMTAAWGSGRLGRCPSVLLIVATNRSVSSTSH